MKLIARFICVVGLVLTSLSLFGCAQLRNPLGVRDFAYVASINDSAERLHLDIDGVRYTTSNMLRAGQQLDQNVMLDISVAHRVVWTKPDGNVYKSYNYSPDDILKDRIDLYGSVVDGIIRASGRNER